MIQRKNIHSNYFNALLARCLDEKKNLCFPERSEGKQFFFFDDKQANKALESLVFSKELTQSR